MIDQNNLANTKFYQKHFEKNGIKIVSHKFCKNQQIIRFIDKNGRHITKQIFNNGKIIIRCKEGIPFKELM